jgi:hypothetical protein
VVCDLLLQADREGPNHFFISLISYAAFCGALMSPTQA